MAQILVTYATKYGSTAEIAEKIGQALVNTGLKTDILPAGNVRDLSGYSAVVLGTSIYVGQWHKDAINFLKSNENTLAEKKVWIFSSGPSGKGDPTKLLEGQVLPAAVKPIIDHIKPEDSAVFHGFINPEKINFIEKWIVTKLVKKPMGDFRDWKMIDSWADSIASSLKKD